MRRSVFVTAASAAALLSWTPGAGLAQTRNRDRSYDDCSDGSYSRDRQARYCEVRESTIPGVNPIDIDASPNGGIRVLGWDRADVLVRAKVQTYAPSMAAARQLASAVRVDATGTQVRAEGPRNTGDDEHWSVSFEIHAPHTAMLTMRTVNGGISIEDFRGTAKFRAQNGGVSLKRVGGEITGQTTNGGLSIDLDGDHWDGSGLDVETSNGGVKLSLPENYSAVLETGTVNGRLNTDFPIVLRGQLNRRFTTTLGAGGATLRAVTTNGGVSIKRR